MSKVIRFKSIAKTPKPPAVVESPTLATQQDLAKMSAEEAHLVGEQLGEVIKALAKAAQPVTPTVPVSTGKLTDQVTTLFKKSDTGIGYKQWSIYVRDGHTVVIEWGHCDKSKQEKVYPFLARPHLMEQWMWEAIHAKLAKGYSRTK